MGEYAAWSVEPELKTEFSNFCSAKGLTASFAIKKFIVACDADTLQTVLAKAKLGSNARTARKSIRIDKAQLRLLEDLCEERNVPVSKAIRAFMAYCVSNNNFPPHIFQTASEHTRKPLEALINAREKAILFR